MSHTIKIVTGLFAVLGWILLSTGAHAVPVTFSKLTGLSGGSPAETAVFKADLSSVGFPVAAFVGLLAEAGWRYAFDRLEPLG